MNLFSQTKTIILVQQCSKAKLTASKIGFDLSHLFRVFSLSASLVSIYLCLSLFPSLSFSVVPSRSIPLSFSISFILYHTLSVPAVLCKKKKLINMRPFLDKFKLCKTAPKLSRIMQTVPKY